MKGIMMPRRARLTLPNVPMHIIQRGNNRQACFFADDDYRFYRAWLQEYAVKTGCEVHAYVLMTNHVHLLVSAGTSNSVGALMKALGQRYAQYANRCYRRTGSLWEGRFRSCLIQEESYLLVCLRYIELNPVRAKMVEHPADYQWSSYRVNGIGEDSALITAHPLYLALGVDPAARQAAYRKLFGFELESRQIDSIRQATNGNFALGDGRFGEGISRALGMRATPGKAGRPRKQEEAAIKDRLNSRN